LTSIQAEIDAKILYVALKAVGQVLDEVRLIFTPEGLGVRELDMAEVSMVDLVVPMGGFDRYELFVENGVEVQRHVVAVRISDITKLFKRPKKDDRVTLSNRAEENMLTVALRGEKNFTFKVPVFPGDGKELPMPKVNLTESFTAQVKAVADFLDGARHITDSAYFRTEQYGAEVALEAKGEISNVSQALKIDDGTLASCDTKNAVRVAYDIARLAKFFQRDFGETVLVELAHEMPLKLTYALNGKDLFRDKPQLVYYVAPKVERDMPPEPKVEEQKPPEPLSPAAIAARMQSPEPAAEPKVEPVEEAKPEEQKKPEPYVCENCGSEIPEGKGKRLEDGDTWLCDTCVNDEKVKYYYGKRMPKAEEKPEINYGVPMGGGQILPVGDAPNVTFPAEKPKEPEPVPVAVDPLDAFRKRFAKK